MTKRNIPDLRDDHDLISLDHCYVLFRYVCKFFELLEGTPGAYAQAADEFDPTLMQNVLEDCFKPAEFSRLYRTEEGKYILAGVFARELLVRMKSEDSEV